VARLSLRGRTDEVADEREATRVEEGRSEAVPVAQRRRRLFTREPKPVVYSDEPDRTEPEPVVVPRAHTRVSAVLGLMVGLTGVYAAMTGVLSRVAIVVGVVGAVLSAMAMGRRGRRVTGGGVALLGLLLSVGAMALGLAVTTGALVWPDAGTDEVMRLRDWLATQAPWLTN